MTVKNLKFHKINLYTFKNNSDPSSGENPKKFRDIKSSNKIIREIIKDIKDKHNGIFSYNNGKSQDTIDFINSDDFLNNKSSGIVFGKISKIKDYHNYQKRERLSKDEISIIQSENEIFESRTFFIIDTNNFVISYISEQSSPSIKSLEQFFPEVSKNTSSLMTIRCTISDIMSLETINSISKNEYIGSVSYIMEIPNDLSEREFPLNFSYYKKLHNQKMMEIVVTQKTEKRGTSLFDDSDTVEDKRNYFNMLEKIPGIKKIIAKTKEKKTDKVRDVLVGKNNPFIMKVNFDFENSNDDTYNINICKRILTEYNDSKDKIEKRIRKN